MNHLRVRCSLAIVIWDLRSESITRTSHLMKKTSPDMPLRFPAERSGKPSKVEVIVSYSNTYAQVTALRSSSMHCSPGYGIGDSSCIGSPWEEDLRPEADARCRRVEYPRALR